MAKTPTSKNQSGIFDGVILHFNAARMRITGAGQLHSELISLDPSISSILPDINLVTTTNREPTILANYLDQRGQLKVSITDIADNFNISKIIIYIKPTYLSYPQ